MNPKNYSRYAYPAAVVLAVALIIAGAVLLFVRSSGSRGIEVILPTATLTPELKVYLSGAVLRPNVYTIKPGDRLADVLEAAGGPTEDADLSQVNLALRLGDQDHIHIPAQGEPTPPAVVGVNPGPTSQDPLDLNTATAEELAERLPDIGPVRAQAIVDYREEHGPFQRIEDLMQVTGIGPATVEGLRDLVTVR